MVVSLEEQLSLAAAEKSSCDASQFESMTNKMRQVEERNDKMNRQMIKHSHQVRWEREVLG